MGKDLKGKELGEGVRQLRNGSYIARCSGCGKRISRTFDSLIEARLWVDSHQNERKNPGLFRKEFTLDSWFGFWIEDVKRPSVKYGTYISYKDIYENRIKDTLGGMRLSEILPIDCQKLLNDESKKHKSSTVNQTKICLQQIFDSAVDNSLIDRTPITKTVKVKSEGHKERRVFSVKEQKEFVDYIRTHKFKYVNECLFLLETGLRIGELLGLKWSDVDLKGRKIKISRSMYFVRADKHYIEVSPKTEAGIRTIPLTDRAYRILKSIKTVRIDYVFLDDPDRKTRVNMDKSLWWVCDRLGMEHISAHGLRHTFATRCVECGMRPKTLQKILGHSSLSITMDLYVHVTDESLEEEIGKLAAIG